jgi:group II intron reverse transcriptase/maturase
MNMSDVRNEQKQGITPGPNLEEVTSNENVKAAWDAVKANNGASGIDRMNVKATEEHFRIHGKDIWEKVLQGTYIPGAVRAVEIPKANGGTRKLGIPNVQDRVIQQAIHQVLSSRWEPLFSDHSYGFRPKRSAHDAIREARNIVQSGKKWVVDIDLKSFFDEVNHDILMRELRKVVTDKRILKLVGRYLTTPMVEKDGKRTKRTKGTPQGGPLSPLLANIYLTPLDRELEKRQLPFTRYADDVAIYAGSRRAAERILSDIVEWIEKNLKIPVNRDKSKFGLSDDTAYLGITIHSDGEMEIESKRVERMKDKVRELWDARQNLTSNQLRNQWKRFILGWWNYFQIATNRRNVESLSGWIRRHMRKCFWIRWHSSAGRMAKLAALGIKGQLLMIAKASRGAWRMARTPGMHRALNNRTLTRYGLIVPWQV